MAVSLRPDNEYRITACHRECESLLTRGNKRAARTLMILLEFLAREEAERTRSLVRARSIITNEQTAHFFLLFVFVRAWTSA